MIGQSARASRTISEFRMVRRLQPLRHMRFSTTVAITALVLMGCASPATTTDDAPPTTRDGVTPASSETRSDLGVSEWHVHESSDDANRTSDIEGVDDDGTVRARVGVRWSAQNDAPFVDIRIDGIVAHVTQAGNGDTVVQGDDAIRTNPFALSTARHLADDLGGQGVLQTQSLRSQSLRPQDLTVGGGRTLVAEDPQFNNMVVACMGSMIRDGWTDYAGIRSFCLAMHGTR
jgi:hypothetical protein